MFCKSCGKQIDNDSNFCSFCGIKQSADFKPLLQEPIQFAGFASQIVGTNNDVKFKSDTFVQGKYDQTYEREKDAIEAGIIFLILGLLSIVFGPLLFEDEQSAHVFKALAAVLSLIFRISVTVWVINIAKRQNRDTASWGLFAFFLPSIALIVIAMRKKLFANIQTIEGLDNEQNSKILSDKAQEFLNDNRYYESLRFSEKAIYLNPKNDIAKDIVYKSKAALADINNVGNSIQTVYRELADNKILKIVSKYNETIGANVSIDELPAPDGIYHYKSGTHKLVVEQSKIRERYFIEKCGKLILEKTHLQSPQQGDQVYLDTGIPAPTGKYNTGFMTSKIIVEEGKFVRYE